MYYDPFELKRLDVSINQQKMTFLNTPNLLTPLGLF